MQSPIYTINEIDDAHLASVIADMRRLGPPRIRACWQGDHYCALEGSHRVEAARRLGLPVLIVEMAEDALLCGHDLDDLDDDCTVADVLEWGSWDHGCHLIECEVVW